MKHDSFPKKAGLSCMRCKPGFDQDTGRRSPHLCANAHSRSNYCFRRRYAWRCGMTGHVIDSSPRRFS